MLILENGDKIMEDGLETKDNSFLVDQLYLIHRKDGLNHNKEEIVGKHNY